jgi:hypothetical protein
MTRPKDDVARAFRNLRGATAELELAFARASDMEEQAALSDALKQARSAEDLLRRFLGIA